MSPARDRMPLPLLIAVWVLLALVAVGALVTVTVGWGHDAWEGAEAEGNIKTIQAIVLGLGFLGVVAGAVVTYRRQETMQDQLDHDRRRLDHERRNDQERLAEDRRKYQLELDKFDQEQAKYAEDQVRETQRRQQERYAQGAQMLAHESPAVRIAGLNVIAALGREVSSEDELRQTCVNLVCAYLRASSPAPTPSLKEGQGESVPDDSYRVVAAEACRLLPTLLERVPSADDEEASPHGLDLDLRQVNLIDLNLSGSYLGTVRCDRAMFSGSAQFGGAVFSEFAGFGEVVFSGGAWFGGAVFGGYAWFVGARFVGGAEFGGAVFGGYARFDGAVFGGAAFGGAIFSGDAWFGGATFSGDAWFDRTTFSGDAGFGRARFVGGVLFRGARFVRYDDRDALGVATFAASEPFEGAVFGSERHNDDGDEDGSPS